jgi:hypothetical protein
MRTSVLRAVAPAILLAAPRINRARLFTTDAAMTFDQATIDSAGAFLIGELERLDPKLHMPLTTVTWSRDIDLREDVTIGDEVSSFTNSSFASPGGMTPNGKAWISADASAIPGIALDIGKTPRPLHLWGMEMKWTLPELETARRLGRPIDSQKLDGLKLKHNMDVDEMVYIGDAMKGAGGMVNHTAVSTGNVVNGAASSPLWTSKTPDEILKDVNALLNAAWNASALAVAPSELRLPPAQFSYIAGQRLGSNNDTTILEFIREKNISSVINNKPLNIQPLKWLTAAARPGASTDRMMCYTRSPEYVRYPMVPLLRTPLEYRQLFQITTYYGRLGEVEVPYPETMRYADGI